MLRENEKAFRVLAIDPGEKRMGLAVSDELGLTAQGLETFEVAPEVNFMDHLQELIDRYEIRAVIIGLPLSMRGTDIEGSERSRALAAQIADRFALEVVLIDERMTSLEAERVLKSGDRSFERGDIDKLSAVLLLQSHLDERRGA
jgi:putative Holliday junction resolvase